MLPLGVRKDERGQLCLLLSSSASGRHAQATRVCAPSEAPAGCCRGAVVANTLTPPRTLHSSAHARTLNTEHTHTLTAARFSLSPLPRSEVCPAADEPWSGCTWPLLSEAPIRCWPGTQPCKLWRTRRTRPGARGATDGGEAPPSLYSGGSGPPVREKRMPHGTGAAASKKLREE